MLSAIKQHLVVLSAAAKRLDQIRFTKIHFNRAYSTAEFEFLNFFGVMPLTILSITFFRIPVIVVYAYRAATQWQCGNRCEQYDVEWFHSSILFIERTCKIRVLLGIQIIYIQNPCHKNKGNDNKMIAILATRLQRLLGLIHHFTVRRSAVD